MSPLTRRDLLARLGLAGAAAGLVGLAFANYAIVAALCVLWGRNFGMGPMERLWRLLSYGPGGRS